MPTTPSSSRRLWYRLTHARQQLRYSLLTPSFGLISSITFAIAGRLSSNTLVRQLAAEWPIEPSAREDLLASLHSSFTLVIASALVVAVAQICVNIMWSRRVFGPEVPILNHLRRLRAGDYASRIQLRQDDEFQAIAEELNQLAAKLEGAAK